MKHVFLKTRLVHEAPACLCQANQSSSGSSGNERGHGFARLKRFPVILVCVGQRAFHISMRIGISLDPFGYIEPLQDERLIRPTHAVGELVVPPPIPCMTSRPTAARTLLVLEQKYFFAFSHILALLVPAFEMIERLRRIVGARFASWIIGGSSIGGSLRKSRPTASTALSIVHGRTTTVMASLRWTFVAAVAAHSFLFDC
mmetsp:Transcript_10863/g.26053  ORF Transcript_10863/g.26053 Transcript_10863/m.26053 type:complete len:201 (-) Transcript_10863:134-736(-)